jgi:hypothetical protein
MIRIVMKQSAKDVHVRSMTVKNAILNLRLEDLNLWDINDIKAFDGFTSLCRHKVVLKASER